MKVNRIVHSCLINVVFILDLARQKTIPVIIHVLLSAAFVILTRQSEQEQSLLTTIIQYLEPRYTQSINKVNSQFLTTTIIQLHTKRKLIVRRERERRGNHLGEFIS